MAALDIPAAKRAGLPVDLARLGRDGDGWLTPDERYALKTWGVCAQRQDHVFMVRVRVPGGVLPTAQARALARLGRRYGPDWLHLTTRQNVELHWVKDRDVPSLLQALADAGLSTRSACGHTLRNVICSEDAGLGLDEPFDCFPDARLVSDTLIARSATLNVELPSRVNVSFGGSPRARDDALVNDAGFVSVVRGGVAGYEMWAGGSLGKAPSLSIRVAEFVPRRDVLAAAEALVDVFVRHGDIEHPAKGRLKFVVQRLGARAFCAEWHDAFTEARGRAHPPAPLLEVLTEADRVAVLAQAPAGGWSTGVRPQRTPGRALLTIDVPLGDTCGSELDLLANLADRYGDGHLVVSRDQDVVLRDIPVADVAKVRAALRERGLSLLGESHVARVRACTGSAVCALGITEAPVAGHQLVASPALGRNSALRVHVSGCPNSCAQHQVGDIGLAGTTIRVNGESRDGYHVFLGAGLERHEIGAVVGRVAHDDLPAAVEAIVGSWEALRHPGEPLGATVRRIGLDAFAGVVESALADRWLPGPEPDATDQPVAVAGH